MDIILAKQKRFEFLLPKPGCTDTTSAQWAEEPSEVESREEVSQEEAQDKPYSGLLDEMAQLIFPS